LCDVFLGFIIYFAYGIQHDGLHIRKAEDYVELDGSNSDCDTVSRNISTSDCPAILVNGKVGDEVKD